MEAKRRLESIGKRYREVKSKIAMAERSIKRLEENPVQSDPSIGVKLMPISRTPDRRNGPQGSFVPSEIKSRIQSAENSIKILDATPIQNQSLLIKYRGNVSVPASWVPYQGVRLQDLPFIPAEKIENLNTYIVERLRVIDGGDLDA